MSSSNADPIHDSENSSLSKFGEAAAPAAPGGGALIIVNNSACDITFGSLHAQTTDGPNAAVKVRHKEAYMAISYANGPNIVYTDYVSTIPSAYALQWWMVNTSTTSNQETSSYVQSTYGNPYWAGAHITAKANGNPANQNISSNGHRLTVGNPLLGNFNQWIEFLDAINNVSCTATWSYDQSTNTYYITIT